jgi:hypothetical protein
MKIIYFILIFFIIIILESCEDPAPSDYQPQYFVEAILIANEPIQDIKLLKTQPIQDTFDYEKALVRNAKVTITGDGKTFELIMDAKGEKGYYYPDSTYKVKPSTTYSLRIETSDKTILTGVTNVPPTTKWLKHSSNPLQYPKDTLNLPASESIRWEMVPDYYFYIISIKNLDTLEYGKYLIPPTQEKNRRTFRVGGRETRYYDLTSWALIANSETSVVWSVFKWFGLHETAIYVPDWNFTRWFLQVFAKGQYDPLLGSITGGGIGTFGSASVIRDTVFLLKNQP